MNKLLVCALSLFPLGTLQSQETRSTSNSGALPSVASIGVAERLGAIESDYAAEPGASQFNFRPVVFGALIGGAIGAVVGHRVGAPQSCPTSPGYSCDGPPFGTAGGAAIGMALGAAVGVVIGMRQRTVTKTGLAPLVNVTEAAVGFRYSWRL